MMTFNEEEEFEDVEFYFNFRAFNPNFFHLEQEFIKTSRRFIWCYGGSSSAKSYSVAQASLLITALVEGADTLVFRKVSSSLEDSIYKDFKTVISTLELEDYFTVQYRKIICKINGAVVIFKGLDDTEKIKGISGFKRVILDEISEFEFADFKQIRKRLRGRIGQQIICMFNPIDEEHWIKKEIFDKQQPVQLSRSLVDAEGILQMDVPEINTIVADKWEGAPITLKGQRRPSNIVVIKSTYENNFWVVGSPCGTFGFIDEQTIMDFEADKANDWDYYSIYALGNWGKLNKGGEMYKNFRPADHVRPKRPWNKELPLHLSFDENVNPYLTLDIFQGVDLETWQIDEICLDDPRNTLKATLNEFADRFPNNGLTVFIYGDATSKKADVKQEKGVNFFVLIENQLRDLGYTTVRRVPTKNPNVDLRCNWFNQVLNGLDGISVEFGDNCTKTISDYKYLKQASDGGKHKEKTKNPTTGVVYEKYGHNTDANDYFFTVYYQSSFDNFGKTKIVQKATIVKRSVRGQY